MRFVWNAVSFRRFFVIKKHLEAYRALSPWIPGIITSMGNYRMCGFVGNTVDDAES